MEKVSKDSVNYRSGQANQHCSLCTMFIQDMPWSCCTLVRGKIKSRMLCDKFERK